MAFLDYTVQSVGFPRDITLHLFHHHLGKTHMSTAFDNPKWKPIMKAQWDTLRGTRSTLPDIIKSKWIAQHFPKVNIR